MFSLGTRALRLSRWRTPGVPRARFFEAFLHVKFSMRKKSAKSRAKLVPRRLKAPKVAPRGSKKPSKIDARQGSEGCFEAAVVEKRRNLTKHYYLLYKSHILASQKITFFEDFRLQNGVKKRFPRRLRKSDVNNVKKVSRKCSRSSRRVPRALPRVPQ